MAPRLLVLLAAPPDAPGCADALAAARRRLDEGAAVRLLVLGAGLGWLGDARLAAWPGPKALCSRDAGERGLAAGPGSADLAWSSVTTALGDLAPGEDLWLLLP